MWVIREILTVLHPVTPKHAGASGSTINNDGVLTLKQTCHRRYSGALKLSSRRFECAQNRSAPFLIFYHTGNILFGAVLYGNARKILRENCVFSTINCTRTRSFHPGKAGKCQQSVGCNTYRTLDLRTCIPLSL